MSDKIVPLIEKAQKGDKVAFASLLTQIDRQGADCLKHPELLRPQNQALRIGITGPPGAGKSTLTGHLISEARKKNWRVGVLAVDPSSPFTRGAILADRIRYMDHSLDPGVFIRSLGTRGSLGGLCSSGFLMARAFDACDYDVLLIETVGVGQTELEVVNVADRTVVVLVPESGDSIQAMKAGLLEIADFFVVNKCDRPGADAFANEITHSMSLAGESVEVVQTSAQSGLGVDQLAEKIFDDLSPEETTHRSSPERIRGEARALLRSRIEDQLESQIGTISSVEDLPKVLK